MLANKKRFVSLLILFVAICLLYWFYFSKPTTFYSKDKIEKILNDTYEEVNANEIQDIIYIDQKHVFVPFISTQKNYSLSFWIWEHHKWKVVNIISKGGSPYIWKINPNDPSSYVIFWNYHPNDQVNEVKFRLLNRRNYLSTMGINYYYPKIHLEQKVNLHNKTYGYLKYPTNWSKIQKLEKQVSLQQDVLFFDVEFQSSLYISMTNYNKKGKEIFPEVSANGNSFSTGDGIFDYVITEDDKEIEERNY